MQNAKDFLQKLIEDKNNLLNIIEITGKSKNTIINYLKIFQIKVPKGFYSVPGKIVGRPKGIPMSEENKKYFSEKFKGENNPFFGKKHSEETRKKMSENHADFTGENNPLKKRIKNNPELLDKLSKISCDRWEKISEENKNIITKKRKKLYKGTIPSIFFKKIINNARIRNIIFEITLEDLFLQWNKQKGICSYTGNKLFLGVNRYELTTASLDRINSDIGYFPYNIQFIHKDVNKMKNCFSEKYFLQLCENVYEQQLKKLNG